MQEVLQWTEEGAPQDGADHLRTDDSRGLVRIEKTDAWADVSRSPSYVLRCRLETAHSARQALSRC